MQIIFKSRILKTLYKPTIFAFLILLLGFNHRVSQQDIITKLDRLSEFQASAVLLNNHLQTIPLKDLAYRSFASINTGDELFPIFNAMLGKYAKFNTFNYVDVSPKQLEPFSTIIIHVTAEQLFTTKVVDMIRELKKTKEVIIAGFGNTRALQKLDEFNMPVIWNPEHDQAAAGLTAQLVFGGVAASGKLKQTVSGKYQEGDGYSTVQTRLKYPAPWEHQGLTDRLNRIDTIVQEAIANRATPGAVVLVVKDGEVVFNRSYGTHTYEDSITTKTDDIFDLASVTKTAATTVAAMKLFEQEQLSLNNPIGSYLPELHTTNKNSIPVRDVLLHQAGFVNLDFYSSLQSTDHTNDSSYFFPVKAADHYFIRRNYYKDVMWPKMLRTPLPTRGRYVYSDISMYVMKEIIERQTGKALDKFVSEEFYKPLGMRNAGYNPLRRFNKDKIVPTERDTYFRKTLLQGYVHDSGASLVDGVAGHAGLFASANDLAILNQMLLNGGTYGGVKYFNPETIELFTSRQSGVSRRGLGFDRAETGGSYPSQLASSSTYGHTGYTGTCVWVDPKQNLIYVFLSNRVYPSASTKLNSMRIRPRIQDAIYAAIAAESKNIASTGE